MTFQTSRPGRRNAECRCDRVGPLLDEAHWDRLQRRYYLTGRERQIAELVCQGLRNDRIAAQLTVRPETIKTHVRNIYRKTGVRSKVLLLLKFLEEAGCGPAPLGPGQTQQ